MSISLLKKFAAVIILLVLSITFIECKKNESYLIIKNANIIDVQTGSVLQHQDIVSGFEIKGR